MENLHLPLEDMISKFISEMARVPFFMYFNEKAKSLRPDLYDKFKNASKGFY